MSTKQIKKRKDIKSSSVSTPPLVEDLTMIKNELWKSQQKTSEILDNLIWSTPEDSLNLAEDIEQLLKVLKKAIETIALIESKVSVKVDVDVEIKVEAEEIQSEIDQEDDNDFLEHLEIGTEGESENELKLTATQRSRRTKSKSVALSSKRNTSSQKSSKESNLCDKKCDNKVKNKIASDESKATNETEILSTSFSTRHRKNVFYRESPEKTDENDSDESTSNNLNEDSDGDSFDPNYVPNVDPNASSGEEEYTAEVSATQSKSPSNQSKSTECPKCGKTLSTTRSLTRHMRESCGRIKSIIINPGKRQRPSRRKKPGTTEQESSNKPRSFPKPYVKKDNLPDWPKSSDGPPWVCSLCNKVFKTVAILRNHILIHAGASSEENAFKCTLCEKSFPVKRYLSDHMSVHVEEKKHTCETCAKSYRLRRTLIRHIHLVHSNAPRTHQCSLCGKLFNFRANLNRHVHKVHENYRPKKCHICSKAFKEKYHLDYHLRTHEKDRDGTGRRQPTKRKQSNPDPSQHSNVTLQNQSTISSNTVLGNPSVLLDDRNSSYFNPQNHLAIPASSHPEEMQSVETQNPCHSSWLFPV